MKTLLSALIGAALAASCLAAGAEESTKERQVQLDIESKTLTDALNDWAQQTGFNLISHATAVTDRLAAPRVKGALTAKDALSQLLEGTSLTYRNVDARTVTITDQVQSTPLSDGQGTFALEQPKLRLALLDDSLRIAQADEPANRARMPSGPIQTNPRERVRDIEEVVVTGTNIRGEHSAGSNVVVLDRRYIESSGYASVPDLLRALPQAYGGGVGEAQSGITVDATAGNINRGSAINLRGLGVDSTLVLVNGRRQAGSGSGGAFFDVSTIPAAAVERIEVLTDGASAIYGSDAIGGVVNFILRRDFEGAESSVRFGSYAGDASELQASQLFGASWNAGNLLLGYQYLDRDDLPRAARTYSASDDLSRFGGSDYRSSNSNPGNIFDPITFSPAFAIPAGQNGRSLVPESLIAGDVNYNDSGSTVDLLPAQEMHSAFMNLTHTVVPGLALFAEGRFTKRKVEEHQGGQGEILTVTAANPFYVDPFGDGADLLVAYNFLDDFGPSTLRGDVEAYMTTLGADVSVGEEWRVTTAVSYGRERNTTDVTNIANLDAVAAALADSDPVTAFNPFGDGSHTNPATIEAVRGGLLARSRSELTNLNAIAEGPIWRLPAGDVRLAVGADYRKESSASSQFDLPTTLPSSTHDLDRDVTAGFAEFALPLLGSSNAVPGVHSLDLSVAARYERYSDFGTTFNPKVGLAWAPLAAWTIRGTWGTSFKAPRLIELYAVPGITNFDLITEVESPEGPVNALLRTGNNPNLREQTADTWTAGIEFAPEWENGRASVSLAYFSIRYQDRIAEGGPPGNPLAVLLQPDAWGSIIRQAPTQAELDDLCSGPAFLDLGFPCDASQVAAIVDLRLNNLAVVESRGVDFGIKYSSSTASASAYSVALEGTYTSEFSQAITENSPQVDFVDTLGSVPKLRLRGSVVWNVGRTALAGMVNHTNGYEDNLSIPQKEVGSWTTMDVSASYEIPEGSGFISNTEIMASAVNVFDKGPPFANVGAVTGGAYGYDTANANPYGRILSLAISKRW